MNSVVLLGRLTRDPDVRVTQGQNPITVARFTLAVDRRFKKEGEQEADFISCIAFRKTAEFLQNYCHQGTKICVSGSIQTGSYTKQDGTKVYTTDVIVDNAEFAQSKDNTVQNAQSYTGVPQAFQQPQQAQPYQAPPQQYQAPPQPQYAQQNMSQYVQQSMQAMNEGFMKVPEGMENGLPFG